MRGAVTVMPPWAMALAAVVACSPSETEIVGYVQVNPGAGGTASAGGARPNESEPPPMTAGAGGRAGAGGSGGTGAAGSGGRGGSGTPSDAAAGGAVAMGGAGGSAGAGGAAGMGGAGGSGMGGAGGASAMGRFKMLVFSKTAGFRHASIANGLTMLRALAQANDFEITATEDAAQFTDQILAPYQIIFFLNTTDDILNAAQQTAMEKFIRGGKGFAGVHSAGDTEDGFGWAWYEELMGSTYTTHSAAGQSGTLRIEPTAMNHPIIKAAIAKGLTTTWNRNEEWYFFKRNVTGLAGVTVLLRATSAGLVGANQHDWPHSWVRTWDGGRAFYFASGHSGSAFEEPVVRDYILQGVLWAAGRL